MAMAGVAYKINTTSIAGGSLLEKPPRFAGCVPVRLWRAF